MKHVSALRVGADPFDERRRLKYRRTVRMLGGNFEFVSDDRRLMALVETAYSALPAQRAVHARPRFEIRLRCVESRVAIHGPPPLLLASGAGTYCGMMDAANFAIVSPAQRAALVSISSSMLAHPYHARYELLEFAVYTLAARAQSLISMHAACVGRGRKGALLIGPSGAGKSTLALHCVFEGMRLLSEDSVFVSPADLKATGIGIFLHVRKDSRIRPKDPTVDALLSRAVVIRRRSGVEKLALDLRAAGNLISTSPLDVAAVVFVSKTRASADELLRPIGAREFRDRLETSQAYAAAQSNWPEFWRKARQVPAFVMGRARDPAIAAARIGVLLGKRR
jgi:hypothetical protein